MTLTADTGKSERGARRGRAAIGLAVALAGAAPATGSDGAVSPPLAPAESYVLPISQPLDQGDTGLWWVFATLSMLETNYMASRPGAQVEFSRAALQVDSVADRFERVIRGEPGEPSEGGLAVEALELIRRNGLVDRRDFHEVVPIGPSLRSLTPTLAGPATRSEKERALDEALRSAFGEKPVFTHVEGRLVSPGELARTVLAGRTWIEFDLARDGADGWGPSRDPEARPETRVRYVGLDALIDLIHQSLKRREAVVAGTAEHAFVVYGADYDAAGRPIAYLVKDSQAPYLSRVDAGALHASLNDVTVAADASANRLARAVKGGEPAGERGP